MDLLLEAVRYELTIGQSGKNMKERDSNVVHDGAAGCYAFTKNDKTEENKTKKSFFQVLTNGLVGTAVARRIATKIWPKILTCYYSTTYIY